MQLRFYGRYVVAVVNVCIRFMEFFVVQFFVDKRKLKSKLGKPVHVESIDLSITQLAVLYVPQYGRQGASHDIVARSCS